MLGACREGCYSGCLKENGAADGAERFGRVDELNHNLLRIFDGAGRLPSSPEIPLIALEWDPRGNLTAVRHPDPAEDLVIIPDSRGRPDEITLPGGLKRSLDYHPATGVLERITETSSTGETRTQTFRPDGTGQIVHLEGTGLPSEDWVWSADGRLLNHTLQLEPSRSAVTHEFIYDAAGLLTGVLGAEMDVHFTYNLRGQVETETRSAPGFEPRTRCHRYDGRGALLEAVDEEGHRTKLGRDGNGDVVEVWRHRLPGGDPGTWDDGCVATGPAAEALFDRYERRHRRVVAHHRGLDPSTNAPLFTETYQYDGFGGARSERFGRDHGEDRVGRAGSADLRRALSSAAGRISRRPGGWAARPPRSQPRGAHHLYLG